MNKTQIKQNLPLKEQPSISGQESEAFCTRWGIHILVQKSIFCSL